MSLNSLAAVLVAILLALAIKNNQEHQLTLLLSDEGGFIKWIVALALVLWIYNSAPRDARVVIGGLLLLGAVAMLLESKNAIESLRKLAE